MEKRQGKEVSAKSNSTTKKVKLIKEQFDN